MHDQFIEMQMFTRVQTLLSLINMIEKNNNRDNIIGDFKH